MKKEITIDFTEGEEAERIEFKGTITLKRLNFSEKNALEEESTDIKIYGTVPQIKVSTSKMKEFSLLKSIVLNNLIKTVYSENKVAKIFTPLSSSYELNIEGIRNLPQEVGDELFLAFTELNVVSDKKKEK